RSARTRLDCRGHRAGVRAPRRAGRARAGPGPRVHVGPRRRGDVPGVCGGAGVKPLVVIDADVLGRQRTGAETYVENLLRQLPALGGGEFRFVAITRRPDLVPDGVDPVELQARPQELRMAWAVP